MDYYYKIFYSLREYWHTYEYERSTLHFTSLKSLGLVFKLKSTIVNKYNFVLWGAQLITSKGWMRRARSKGQIPKKTQISFAHWTGQTKSALVSAVRSMLSCILLKTGIGTRQLLSCTRIKIWLVDL